MQWIPRCIFLTHKNKRVAYGCRAAYVPATIDIEVRTVE
eukprot:SAG31_NODE_41904_length_274_cov_0.582857_1_plen_38_part_10